MTNDEKDAQVAKTIRGYMSACQKSNRTLSFPCNNHFAADR